MGHHFPLASIFPKPKYGLCAKDRIYCSVPNLFGGIQYEVLSYFAGVRFCAGQYSCVEQSEDPSYEPSRNSTRSTPARGAAPTPKPTKTTARPAETERAPAYDAQSVPTQTPDGPQVKYILDGKPYYDDPPKAEWPPTKKTPHRGLRLNSRRLQRSPPMAAAA